MNPNTLINLFAFTVLTLLWLAFAGALLFKRETLDQAWRAFRGWPLLAQITVTLLVLPLVAGLWIWQAKWPAWLRLVLVAGLAWMTVYTFLPTAAF